MKYCSINELEHFDFRDCVVETLHIDADKIILKVQSLIIKASNSQNANYTDSYAADTMITFQDSKVVRLVKEGYKAFDANDQLLEEVPDEEVRLDASAMAELLSKSFLVNVRKEEGFYLEFEMPELEAGVISDCYELTVSGKDITIEWDSYMNRVQQM